MRRVQFLVFSLIGLLSLLPLAATAQVIEVTPRTYDFGDMKQEETRSTTVTVTNKGAAKLVISEVKADCGCTVPDMETKELGPMESAPLIIEFNSKRFTGKEIKTVQIFSNDPVNHVVDVMITANVHTPIVVDPKSRRLGFPLSMVGDGLTRTATFTAMNGVPLEIRADHSLHRLFNVEVHNKVGGDPTKAELVATIPTDVKPGSHRDNVRVQTNLPDMPTVDIELKADVRTPILVTPRVLSFRYQRNFKVNLRVKAFDHRVDFKVLGVETDLPELTLGDVIVAPGNEFIIPVSGSPIAASDPRAINSRGRIKGSITIETDLISLPKIKVPVTYMIRM